jgi:glutathione S-transferase
MILRHGRFSPFSRKVRACLLELPRQLDVELVETSPWEDKTLRSVNPMCKVPTLVLDDGEAIFDSVVICEYLATAAGDTTIVPQRSPAAWTVLRDQAMGDGLCEAAIAIYRETLRPEAQQSSQVIARQREALEATLDLLEGTIERRAGRVDIGTIAIGCGIGHIELRLKQVEWRTSRPALSAWHDAFDARKSMAATRPY